MIKNCVICGEVFTVSPSDKTVTCSPSCRSERAKRVATSRRRTWSKEKKAKLSDFGQTTNLKKGTPAALQSPKSGPYETNVNALVWEIRSPDGTIYTMRNLNLWLRDNADLLPGTPEQARAGIMQIKRSRYGKTKRAVNQWKGCTLVSWEEGGNNRE